MAFSSAGRRESRVGALVESASVFHLTRHAAAEIVDAQVETIQRDWDEVCDRAELTCTGPPQCAMLSVGGSATVEADSPTLTSFNTRRRGPARHRQPPGL